MSRIFGTDGVRGLANKDITATLALQLGEAAARLIGGGPGPDGQKPKAVIGRDTRISASSLTTLFRRRAWPPPEWTSSALA